MKSRATSPERRSRTGRWLAPEVRLDVSVANDRGGLPWLPESLISVAGVAAFNALPIERRHTLGRIELLYFLSLGMRVEQLLIRRTLDGLSQNHSNLDSIAAHLREIKEEAEHSLMFVELLRADGHDRPLLRRLPDPLLELFAYRYPFHSVGFWLAVWLAEELGNEINRAIRRQREGIEPAVIQVITDHLRDEARHVQFAKQQIARHLTRRTAWQRQAIRQVVQIGARRLLPLFLFPPESIYEKADLTPARIWRRRALTNLSRHRLKRNICARIERETRAMGLGVDGCGRDPEKLVQL